MCMGQSAPSAPAVQPAPPPLAPAATPTLKSVASSATPPSVVDPTTGRRRRGLSSLRIDRASTGIQATPGA